MPGKDEEANRRLLRQASFPLPPAFLLDPSTGPFLRAFGLGYLGSTIPSVTRLLIGLVVGRKSGRPSMVDVMKKFVALLVQGFSPRGLAFASGIAVGGAKWGESRVEPIVKRLLEAANQKRWRLGQKRKGGPGEEGGGGAEEAPVLSEDAVKRVATFASATIASLISITLLQNSSGYARPTRNPSLAANAFPASVDTPTVVQSPTLDITLFMVVRAADTLIRTIYEHSGEVKGRSGVVVRFVAHHADTLVFQLACWRIMWCWFYLPERLVPSYSRWISRLARLDPRLLNLLQYARSGEYVYGKVPSEKVAVMSAGIANALARDFREVNPQYIQRLPCKFVHGKLGGPGRCETNAARRWARGFLDALYIYVPVHLIPHLLFGMRSLLGRPVPVLLKIILAASRSSAFLATFLSSIYASVCKLLRLTPLPPASDWSAELSSLRVGLVRTGIPALFPSASQQILDSGVCTALGCFLCGFSVLIENKHRRREMALFVAPRALYALMDEIVPAFLSSGATGVLLSRWIERAIFAASSGVVLSATVHRPDLVSGVVRGVMGKAVGEWAKNTQGAGAK